MSKADDYVNDLLMKYGPCWHCGGPADVRFSARRSEQGWTLMMERQCINVDCDAYGEPV